MSFCGEILFPVHFNLQSGDLHTRYSFVQNYIGTCIQFRKIYFLNTETRKFLPELKGNKF